MPDMSSDTTAQRPPADLHTGWTGRVIGYVAVLVLVNVMVDTVLASPTFVLPQLRDAFDTTQFAWLDSSAMLAGAMWAPLLGKTADIYGKRRILVITLIVAGLGGLVSLLAPNIGVFVLGRVLQGAAVAALFLTVAIIRDVCAPKFAMIVTGVVTSGSAAFGIVQPFVLEIATKVFGWQFVFVVSAAFAAVAALFVRLVIPNSRITTPGRVDVAGALVLGGGLAGVLVYISLGQEFGWLSLLPVAALVLGVVALLVWYFVLSRVPEPVIDVRGISAVLGLGLLVVVMGTGAYRSMLALFSLLIDVSPDEGLGYGIAGPAALGLMFGIPSIGIMLGGIVAGAIATRVGPAWPLAAGLTLGTIASLTMFTVGAANLPIAVICSFLLSVTAGSLVTSGFNLASILAPPERQGTVSSMVMVMVAIGSVTMSFVGSAILGATDVVVAGETVNSSLGVHSYIAVAGCAFVLAAVPVTFLLRRMRGHVVTDVPVSQV
ncbi:putative MFS family arabinose efflux permease [Nonomuraea fuscirosea]|uniref:Putative MFS family arabinose efflux permease n=2 Tax=Nonomuraea fuscirosea TaxID=1291556 RepID=A0A2T0N3Q8_9ACTN|nr:putative MFS family arabinose efflux permease [Nonomuraea fuscirosea]